jgi:hypothetical protein
MLPPVNASVTTQPVSAPAIGQREARSDGPSAVGQAQPATPQQTATALPQGAASEPLQSLRQLADLLASQQIDAEDILTRLAIDFATALGEAPLPEETPQDFSSRLATLIRQAPAAALQTAQQATNLSTFGISPQAFAEALADPASPAAARIVAMAEDPGAKGLQQMLKSAIESYEQNGAPAPAAIAAQRAAAAAGTRARNVSADAAEPHATAQDGKGQLPAAAAREQGRGPAAEAAAAPRQAAAGAAAMRSAETAAPQQPRPAQAASAPQARQPQPALDTALQHAAAMPDEGQPTMQVLRGFNVVVANVASNVATRAADVLKTVAALAQQAEVSQTFAPAGTKVAETVRTAPAAAADRPATPETPAEAAPAIAGRAQEAARAMEGKVIPLFARPIGAEDVDNVDVEQLIRMAQQQAAKAEPQQRLPEMALAQQAAQQQRLPDAVPFAQLPYPFVREEEEKHPRRGFGEQAGRDGEGEEMTGEDGQSLWHGDGEQAERREEPEIEEHPFEADEPLKRNPTDAERALHMYQRFGGF